MVSSMSANISARRKAVVTLSGVDIEGVLARLAAGGMRAGEMLQVSRGLMAIAKDAQWSRAAAHYADALYAHGRIGEAMATFEEAWEVADRLDDADAGALAAALAGSSCAKLYDYPRAEEWCVRELGRSRSRHAADWRYGLTMLLASARVSQGDLAGARELLEEFEGAASNHFLLAYAEGDWERGVMLRRKELEAARAAGRLQGIGDCASLLGRFARLGNQRVEAEAYLNEGLAAAVAWPDLNRELFMRVELALLDADRGRVEKAKAQLARCREMLASGEDWRGHLGAFASASALVAAADYLHEAKGSSTCGGFRYIVAVSCGCPTRWQRDFAPRSESFAAIMRRGRWRAYSSSGRGCCSRLRVIARQRKSTMPHLPAWIRSELRSCESGCGRDLPLRRARP